MCLKEISNIQNAGENQRTVLADIRAKIEADKKSSTDIAMEKREDMRSPEDPQIHDVFLDILEPALVRHEKQYAGLSKIARELKDSLDTVSSLITRLTRCCNYCRTEQ